MRIFYACADRGVPPGGTKGASIHFECFARALAELGHDVVAFLSRPGPFPLPLVHRADRTAILTAARATGVPDLVCERYSLGSTGGLEAARELGVPFVLEVNAPLLQEATRHRPRTVRPEHAGIEQRLFREADVVLAVSEPLRRFVSSVRGTDRGTAVLYNGCRLAEQPDVPAERDLLAFLGHPKPWHGVQSLPGLLRALDGARLLVVGGGSGADELRRAAVAGRVEITGVVPPAEVPAHLARASIGLAPYPAQTFFYFCPLKVLEYMAAGLPVVTTRQGDLPVLVGDAGLLVPPGDERALHDAVLALLRDPGLSADLGRRGQERVRRDFTWERAAQRFTELVGGGTAR